MRTATSPHVVARRPDPLRELQDELLHIRDLVFLRDLLSERGATPAELRSYAAAIDEARTHLAETARRAATGYAAAA